MERITYRITLDAHRSGVQRTLQGFETADILARRISIGLVSGSDTYDLPMTNVVAMMYVTTPSAKKPSINECVIDGNTIIYDVEKIVEEGITEMQLKVIETSPEGAKKVLLSPRFAVEVTKSNTNDAGAVQTATFTALEQAVAKAEATYESRLLRVVIEDDCVFKAYYADGTVYENDYFRDAMYNGNALLSQSYAVGGAGVRQGEDIDNSKYYSNVSRSASEDAKKVYEDSHELMLETQKQANYTYFNLNFETGNLGYISTNVDFNINKETGELETTRDATYTPEEVIASNVDAFINEKSQEIDGRISNAENNIVSTNTRIDNVQNDVASTNERIDSVEALAKGRTLALSFDTYMDMVRAVNETMTDWNVGQNIYIVSSDVPDLWVSGISESWVTSTYDDDNGFADYLRENGYIQIGNYVLLPLETEKVDLSEYAKLRDTAQMITSLEEDISTKLPIGNIAIVTTPITTPNDGTKTTNTVTVDYPEGFNKDNSIVLSIMGMNPTDYDFWVTPMPPCSISFINGGSGLHVKLKSTHIEVGVVTEMAYTSLKTYTVKVVLLRLDVG